MLPAPPNFFMPPPGAQQYPIPGAPLGAAAAAGGAGGGRGGGAAALGPVSDPVGGTHVACHFPCLAFHTDLLSLSASLPASLLFPLCLAVSTGFSSRLF